MIISSFLWKKDDLFFLCSKCKTFTAIHFLILTIKSAKIREGMQASEENKYKITVANE